jgi:hypothetical protein
VSFREPGIPRHIELLMAWDEARKRLPGVRPLIQMKEACRLSGASHKEMARVIRAHLGIKEQP